jgi:hypothetical protein
VPPKNRLICGRVGPAKHELHLSLQKPTAESTAEETAVLFDRSTHP